MLLAALDCRAALALTAPMPARAPARPGSESDTRDPVSSSMGDITLAYDTSLCSCGRGRSPGGWGGRSTPSRRLASP